MCKVSVKEKCINKLLFTYLLLKGKGYIIRYVSVKY